MKRLFVFTIGVCLLLLLGTFTFTLIQVQAHQQELANNLAYRSSLLADGLRESVEPDFVNKSPESLQQLVEKYSHRQRIAGIGVVGDGGKVLAASSSLPSGLPEARKIAVRAMDAAANEGNFTQRGQLYAFASPLRDEERIVGALVVVQYASYIQDELGQIWLRNFSFFGLQLAFLLVFMSLLYRLFIYGPIHKLRAIIKVARLANDNAITVNDKTFLSPIVEELEQIQKELTEVRTELNQQAAKLRPLAPGKPVHSQSETDSRNGKRNTK